METYKNRPDVQFITFNMDDNPGLLDPFMKEQKLSLIVVPAHTFVNEALKIYGIPQNGIVDRQGVVRLKGIGYDATEKWEIGMTEAIEKVRRPATTAPTAEAGSKR